MNEIRYPDRIRSYFQAEKHSLILITLSGLVYNIGLLAGPLFEGKLAQCLLDIFQGKKTFSAMLQLSLLYVLTIAVVQGSRYLKRLYVRRFANNINRRMKQILYSKLVHKTKAELEQEKVGSFLTKAISDVDACVEGMRKFTTEVFDTGVALLGYVALLFWYDWRLALLSLLFPPLSYVLAEKMKKTVQRTGAAFKESSSRLSDATLDRVSGAVSYRVFGCEEQRNADYEEHLTDYEQKAVRANIWVSALPPLYRVLSMTSVLLILYFGVRNVRGTGFQVWDIAAFTTFLSCFTKLSQKSSSAAKLFNSIQKAHVSWARIQPILAESSEDAADKNDAFSGVSISQPAAALTVRGLGMSTDEGACIFRDLSFEASPGQIVGITGPVACGKSTLGRAFLCEQPYLGSILWNGQELSGMSPELQRHIVGYLGHDPELMSDTIADNILLGSPQDPAPYLHAVCLDKDLSQMEDGSDTRIGSGGVLLSGGQQQRVALARALAHHKPLYILDDPFSALDRNTELEAFRNLRRMTSDSIVLLISHRLYLFPELDQVIWMENGHAIPSTHQALLAEVPQYAALYHTQTDAQ